MIIRNEKISDSEAISEVTIAAFRNIPDLTHEGIPQHVFLALPFDNETPHGTVVFHEGFLANG